MFFSHLTILLTSLLFTLSSVASAPLITPVRPSTSLTKRWFEGRGTYYDVGLGSCEMYNTDDEPIIALNADQYKPGVCGKWVTIRANGRKARGIIRDKCPGCGYGGLDLSPSLFKKFDRLWVGVIKVRWDLAMLHKDANVEDTDVSMDDPNYVFDPAMELKAEDLLDKDEADTSKVDTSKVDTPKVDTPKVDTPKVDTSEVDTSEVDTSEVNTSETDVSEDATA